MRLLYSSLKDQYGRPSVGKSLVVVYYVWNIDPLRAKETIRFGDRCWKIDSCCIYVCTVCQMYFQILFIGIFQSVRRGESVLFSKYSWLMEKMCMIQRKGNIFFTGNAAGSVIRSIPLVIQASCLTSRGKYDLILCPKD